MQYTKSNPVTGNWIKGIDIISGSKAKLVSETTRQPSQFLDDKGQPKVQDVAKIKIEGKDNTFNISVNRTSIDGLVDAFGSDSKDWMNKVLTVETETTRIAGKRGTAIYLIPEGYARVDDDNGYAKIAKKGEHVETAPKDTEFDEIPF